MDWFHDEYTKPVQLNAEDRFMLDGQLLVMTSTGTDYGEDGSEYDTEAAGFSVVTSHGQYNSGTSPDHFTVVTKDGTRMEFGNTTGNSSNSKVLDGADDEVIAWRLNKVMDPFGNYIRYEYAEDELESIVTKIEYTGNDAAGIAPYSTVEFSYMLRDDVKEQFIAGYGRKSTHLLKQIMITCEGNPFKRYVFNYTKRDIAKSYLQEVREFGADDVKQLNPTRIKYGDESIEYLSEESTVPSNASITSADFDGDGDAEILFTDWYEDEDGYRFNTNMTVKRRDGPSGFTTTFWETFPPGYMVQSAYTGMDMPARRNYSQTVDVNGDGRCDIVMVNLSFDGYHHLLTDVVIYFSNSEDATVFDEVHYLGPSDFSIFHPDGGSFMLGDFDGNGKTDIVTIGSDGIYYRAYLWQHSTAYDLSYTWLQHWGPYVGSVVQAFQNYAMDIDGDGADEFVSYKCPYNTYVSHVFELEPAGGGYVAPHFEPLWTGGLPQGSRHSGDFNGDGKADVLCAFFNGDIQIWYSNGTGFYNSDPGISISSLGEQIVTADFNGDGITDLLHKHEIGTELWELRFYFFHGHEAGFAYEAIVHAGPIGALAVTNDVNGDGRMEVLHKGAVVGTPIFFIRPDGHERSATTIMDGVGSKTRFAYAHLTSPDIYDIEDTNGDIDRTYPNVSIEPAWEAVDSVHAPDGIGGEVSATYDYSNGRVNLQGRGFLGFGVLTVANEVMNIRQESIGTFDEGHAVLLPASSQAKTFGGQAIATTDRLPVIVDIGDRYWVKETLTTTTDDLSGAITTVATANWDVNGNVGLTTTDINGIETIQTQVLSYGAYGPSTIPAKPDDIVVTRSRGTAPAAICTTSFSYGNATGQLEQKIEFAGQNKALTTDFSYHDTGNLHSTSRHFPGIGGVFDHRSVGETYDDDPKYRFPTELITYWHNPPGLLSIEAHATHDPKWGKPLSTLSTDGLTTLHQYDVFGRLEWTSVPHVAGSERYHITVSRDWDITPDHVYWELVSHPGEPDVKTWYDRLGREVKSETEGYNGNLILASKTYDARGNVATTTAPHLAGEDELVTTYHYDDYNRLDWSENLLTGTTTTAYTYANEELTTTVTNDAGQWNKTVKDATGRTVAAEDEGGKLYYTYDSWGNLLSVKHNTVTLSTSTYDSYGRQTSLEDADAGETSYEYNAFGELVYQKDANGNETELIYDNLGRLVLRNGEEGPTSYSYFWDGTMFNDNPVEIEGPDAIYRYEYDDPYNRLTSETRVINGEDFITSHTYDDYDRISTTTYPSDLLIRHGYSPDGTLSFVETDDHDVLFDGIAQNGLGQWTGYALADGNTMTIDRHFGYPTRYHADGTVYAQELVMKYDYATGNLLRRWDKTKDRRESFTYDFLNRLTGAMVEIVDDNGNVSAGVSNHTYAYDGVSGQTRGMLTSKGDVGKFGFTGVHAVASAHGWDYPTDPYDPPDVISQKLQEITYTPFSKAAKITETVSNDEHALAYWYGPDQQRARAEHEVNGAYTWGKVYAGGYERFDSWGEKYEIHYIPGGDGLCAIIVHNLIGDDWSIHTVYKDHLGSILTLVEMTSGTVVAEQNFDPWGRHRNPQDWTYDDLPVQPLWLYRGFTGHEHVEPFMLINMNGRMYDPVNGRLLSPDNYVIGSERTQAYNRYSYAANNPLTYTDPSGEIIWAPIIIGAMFGAFNGFAMGQANGAKGTEMAGYIFGGALFGGISAGVGNAIATTGMAFAGTSSMAASSLVFSGGMHAVSGGTSDVMVNLGAASYNLSDRTWRSFHSERSFASDLSYGIGTFSNLSDVYAFAQGAYGCTSGKVDLVTKNDHVGHAAVVRHEGTENIISHGPFERVLIGGEVVETPYTNDWWNHLDDTGFDRATVSRITITNVKVNVVEDYASAMGRHPVWRLTGPNCTSSASNALLKAGVLNMPILRHPVLLELQMLARQHPYFTTFGVGQ